MMRFIARITLTAALAATLASHAGASAVQSYMYNTSGNIAGTTGVNLGYPIGFTSGPTAMLTTPGTFTLGTITTGLLPAGATLTYDNTPFTINLGVGSVANNSYNYNGYNGYYGFSPAYSYQINGVLNGSLTDGTSTLFPTITSITGSGSTPPFDASDLKFNLQGIAAPSGTTYGTTTLTAHVDVTGTSLPSPAPEPTSVAIFAAALAGFAWNRHRGKKRITRSLSSSQTSA